MAMSKTVLGKAIADLVIDENAPAEMKQRITQQWTDIAGAIIDEIKKSTITVASGITVTIPTTSDPGKPSSGATSTTGTATIS